MTLRAKPLVVVSVTKKPDGRLMLNYSRPETGAPRSSNGGMSKSISASNLEPAA